MRTRMARGALALAAAGVALAAAGGAGAYQTSTPVAEQLARVEAWKEIDRLRRQTPPDFAAIKRIYEERLRSTVQRRDQEFEVEMDRAISAAIEGGLKGQEPRIAGQIVDKTLRRAFNLNVRHELREATSPARFADKSLKGAIHNWDEGWAYFQGLRDWVRQRAGEETEARIVKAFEAGAEAIRKDDLVELKVQSQIIDKSLVRAFHRYVIYEAEEVAKNREKDPARAREQQVEGYVSFLAIEDKMGGNPEGAKLIKAQLSGELSGVNPEAIRRELVKGLAAKVREYLGKTVAAVGTPDARVHAWEGAMFLSAFEEEAARALGEGRKKGLFDAAGALIRAAAAGDRGAAEGAARQVAAGLDELLRAIGAGA